MGGPPEPRGARSEGKLHDPPIQCAKRHQKDGWRSYAFFADAQNLLTKAGHDIFSIFPAAVARLAVLLFRACRCNNMTGRTQIAQCPYMDRIPDDRLGTFLSRIQSPALLDVAQHWNKARGMKRMPSWADLSLSAPLPDAERTWAFAYHPETGDITGILAGRRYGKWVGENFYGGRLKDIHSPANYEEAQRLLTRIVTTPLAFRSSGRLFAVDTVIVTGERIALPVAEDGQTGDGILGASDYTPQPLSGFLKLIHENVEWYAI